MAVLWHYPDQLCHNILPPQCRPGIRCRKQCLRRANLLTCDAFGWTPLHYAAANGYLDQVPQCLLADQLLLLKNGDGWNCIHLAFSTGHADQLPPAALTPANVAVQGSCEANWLQLAAMNGLFDRVPKRFQTTGNALITDSRQQTCLHLAAAGGHLKSFPQFLMSWENLNQHDAMGRPPLDYYRQQANKG